jgi:hypothetical protein
MTSYSIIPTEIFCCEILTYFEMKPLLKLLTINKITNKYINENILNDRIKKYKINVKKIIYNSIIKIENPQIVDEEDSNLFGHNIGGSDSDSDEDSYSYSGLGRKIYDSDDEDMGIAL